MYSSSIIQQAIFAVSIPNVWGAISIPNVWGAISIPNVWRAIDKLVTQDLLP